LCYSEIVVTYKVANIKLRISIRYFMNTFFCFVVVLVGFAIDSTRVIVDEDVGSVSLMVQSLNIAMNTPVNLYYSTSSREATGKGG